MSHQRPDPGYIPRLHQILETLQAEIAEREEATHGVRTRTPSGSTQLGASCCPPNRSGTANSGASGEKIVAVPGRC